MATERARRRRFAIVLTAVVVLGVLIVAFLGGGGRDSSAEVVLVTEPVAVPEDPLRIVFEGETYAVQPGGQALARVSKSSPPETVLELSDRSFGPFAANDGVGMLTTMLGEGGAPVAAWSTDGTEWMQTRIDSGEPLKNLQAVVTDSAMLVVAQTDSPEAAAYRAAQLAESEAMEARFGEEWGGTPGGDNVTAAGTWFEVDVGDGPIRVTYEELGLSDEQTRLLRSGEGGLFPPDLPPSEPRVWRIEPGGTPRKVLGPSARGPDASASELVTLVRGIVGIKSGDDLWVTTDGITWNESALGSYSPPIQLQVTPQGTFAVSRSNDRWVLLRADRPEGPWVPVTLSVPDATFVSVLGSTDTAAVMFTERVETTSEGFGPPEHAIHYSADGWTWKTIAADVIPELGMVDHADGYAFPQLLPLDSERSLLAVFDVDDGTPTWAYSMSRPD